MQADVVIGVPHGGGPRGVLAERTFATNEVVISIPQHMTIPLEGTPEEACVLLLHMLHRQRQRFQPWLDMLPGAEDFIAWDCLGAEQLSELQCPEMVSP